MTATTVRTSGQNDVRVDLNRDREGKWRSRVCVPGHILADSGEGYSRRIDCLLAAMRVVGVGQITWLGSNPVYDYGQASRAGSGVEVFIWKARRP